MGTTHVPNIFDAGTRIEHEPVNENFQYLEDQIYDLSANFTSFKARWGIVGDGIIDDQPAFVRAKAAGVTTYYLDGITPRFASAFVFQKGCIVFYINGAMVKPDLAITVENQGATIAGLTRITTGLGTYLSGKVSKPEWYGAVGTGLVSDLSALNACMASATASQFSDGGRATILLAGYKTYGVDAAWQISPTVNCELLIEGAGTLLNGSRIIALNTFAGADLSVMHILGSNDPFLAIAGFTLRNFATVPSSLGYGIAVNGLQVGSASVGYNLSGGETYSNIDNVYVADFPNNIVQVHARQIKYTNCASRYSTLKNVLQSTAILATQDITTTNVPYTLSFKGTGTITLTGTSTAGPLVGTGVNNRVTLTFTPTAGTLHITVSGSVTSAQLEIGVVATSYLQNPCVAYYAYTNGGYTGDTIIDNSNVIQGQPNSVIGSRGMRFYQTAGNYNAATGANSITGFSIDGVAIYGCDIAIELLTNNGGRQSDNKFTNIRFDQQCNYTVYWYCDKTTGTAPTNENISFTYCTTSKSINESFKITSQGTGGVIRNCVVSNNKFYSPQKAAIDTFMSVVGAISSCDFNFNVITDCNNQSAGNGPAINLSTTNSCSAVLNKLARTDGASFPDGFINIDLGATRSTVFGNDGNGLPGTYLIRDNSGAVTKNIGTNI